MSPIFVLWYLIHRGGGALWHWTRRRFTVAGFCVAGALVAATPLSVDTENTVAYQACSMMVPLLLLAFAGSWIFRARFAVARRLPRLGTVGQPFHYRVTVSNLTATPQNGLTLLDNLGDSWPRFAEWREFQLAENRRIRPFQLDRRFRSNPFCPATIRESPVPPLAPNGKEDVRVEVTPLRRGILRFTGITLARPDPLGLFRSFLRVPKPETVLVLPKRYWLPPIALPGYMKYQAGGVALAANVGQSEEFVALRDYQRGDPQRYIHWRSWAKAGKPIVKEFEDEFFVRHALVLDTFTQDRHSEMLEEAVSVAASFACTTLTQETLLDLLFVGGQSYCFTAGRSLGHSDQMLEILAIVRSCPDKPFQLLEHLVLNHSARVSGCVCVLLAWDEARRELVKKLHSLDIPVQVLVVVPPGRTGLDPGPLREEPHRFHVLEMGKIGQGLARLGSVAS